MQTELQRRAMAGVIILDATASAVLGLPPLLSPEGLPYALPNGCEDDSVPADSVDPPPIPQNSSSLFMRETTKLLAIQIQVLTSLYSSAATATSQWPDVNSILLNARQLDRWQSALPPILNYSQDGAEARAGNDELNLQAHVLHARFLNLKLLVHRPMIFHICQKASSSDLLSDAPSHLDADIARSSMSHCCSAALLLIEHVTDSWDHGRRVGGAWCKLPEAEPLAKHTYQRTNKSASRVPPLLLSFCVSGYYRRPHSRSHCISQEYILSSRYSPSNQSSQVGPNVS